MKATLASDNFFDDLFELAETDEDCMDLIDRCLLIHLEKRGIV